MKIYLLSAFLLRELNEQFGNLALLEDEDLDNGSKFGESFVDELVGDLKRNGVVYADEENSGGLLLFGYSAGLLLHLGTIHARVDVLYKYYWYFI